MLVSNQAANGFRSSLRPRDLVMRINTKAKALVHRLGLGFELGPGRRITSLLLYQLSYRAKTICLSYQF